MTPRLMDVFTDRWTNWFPGEGAVDLEAAIIARPSVSPRRGVVLLQPARHRGPRAVVKVGLEPAAGLALRRESHNLARLEEAWDTTIESPVPKQLDFAQEGPISFLALERIPGAPVALPMPQERLDPLGRWQLARFLKPACEISADLAMRAITARPDKTFRASAVPDRFAEHFRLRGQPRHKSLRLARHLDGLDAEWTGVWQHGDVAQGNLLVTRRRAALVDWELADDTLPPWFDVCYALLSICVLGPRPLRSREQIVEFLGPATTVGRIGRARLERSASPGVDIWTCLALTAMEAALRSRDLGRSETEWWKAAVSPLLDIVLSGS